MTGFKKLLEIMKKSFIMLALMLIGAFAFANTELKEESAIMTTEAEYITINSHCYVRWCWLEGTTKVCTPWNEVPCDKGFKTETLQPIED